jgi:hypothetical protein
VIAFLDTEFTGLVGDPQLLSVGIVVGKDCPCEFYAEVTDRTRILAASSFARDAVLPQFGKVAGAACSYLELGRRLSAFLATLSRSLKAGETIEIAFESDKDWEFLLNAVKDAGVARSESVVGALSPVNVYNIAGFAAGDLAARSYFKAQALAPLSRHHALCDARALRIAFDAANASSAVAMSLSRSAPPLSQKDINTTRASRQASMARAH